MSAPKEPYGLHPGFEDLMLYYAATNQQFWSRVGHVVDPERLAHPLAKLVFESARLIARDVGHGPDNGLITIQRLARRVHEGKVTHNELSAVNELLDRVCDLPPPKVDEVVEELVPVLKRQLYSTAIQMAADDWAKHGDFNMSTSLFEKARRLGETELVIGSKLAPAGFEEIEKMNSVARLPTGVIELDIHLGGLPVGELGIWIGDSGGGKSMALAHQAAEAIRWQHLVGFVTLELPRPVQMARLYANITGVPVNQILQNVQDRAEAKRRMEMVEGMIGICEVAEMPSHATTARDLIEWIDSKEQEHGVKMQALVVDYADKLHEPKVRDGNGYLEMRYVYEGLRRDIAVERQMWVWTGSQATRPTKDSQKKLGLGHVADSMHKVRVADVVLTLNPREDGQMEFFVAKNRLGKSGFSVGPMITDFEHGRLVPLARELMQW